MNCLLYARVSTDKQAQKDLSIPAQIAAMKEYVRRNGWKIAGHFVDEGESARTADRPELKNLLRHSKEHKEIDAVIVHKLDRMARNLVDYGKLYRGKHKPIVPAELFYRVQEVLKRRNKDAGEKGRLRFLLRGIAECRVCGQRLTGEVHPRGSYYRCIPDPHSGKCDQPYTSVQCLDDQLEALYPSLKPRPNASTGGSSTSSNAWRAGWLSRHHRATNQEWPRPGRRWPRTRWQVDRL